MTATRGNVVIDVNLGYRGAFDHRALLLAVRAHAVHGLEECDVATGRHRRAVRAPHGPAVVEIEHRTGANGADHDGSVRRLIARLTLRDPADEATVVATIRRWLDLDADTDAICAALAGDPVIGPLVARRPGLRVLGSTDPFETAVMTVLGQQVSLAAARTFGARLVEAFGTVVTGDLRAFPDAERLASTDPVALRRTVGLTGARAETVVRLAAVVASGLAIGHDAPRRELDADLLAVPGIGRWTVDYLVVRTSADRDAFVPGDLVLRRALGVRTAREATDIADAWRPWRTYALLHLWTHAAYDPPALMARADPRGG